MIFWVPMSTGPTDAWSPRTMVTTADRCDRGHPCVICRSRVLRRAETGANDPLRMEFMARSCHTVHAPLVAHGLHITCPCAWSHGTMCERMGTRPG